jgi:uncharacterized protein YbjT (DUF2867 family)
MSRRALLIGATGLVGRELLALLLADPGYPKVTVLARSIPSGHDPRLTLQRVTLDRLDQTEVPPADDAYCALGTTIRQAGSRTAFAAVDRDGVVAFARLARRAGCRRFMLVSALGADPGSAFFYNRIKGEAEQAVGELGFDALHIAQPSLLLGRRSEARPAESLAKHAVRLLAPLMIGGLRPYRPVEAGTVASQLVRAAHSEVRGVVRHRFHLAGAAA